MDTSTLTDKIQEIDWDRVGDHVNGVADSINETVGALDGLINDFSKKLETRKASREAEQ